jgi:hypothetical protein
MTRRHLTACALATALVLPTAAAAHGHGDHQAPKRPPVSWIVRGTVTAYTAVGTDTDGSLTITVTGANRKRDELKGDSLTFVLKTTTKVILADGPLEVGEKVVVKLKAPRGTAADDIDTFVPRQLLDPANPPA